MMKVALLFDSLTGRGGAERNALILAKALNADIYTCFVDWNNIDAEFHDSKIYQLGLYLKASKFLTRAEIATRFSNLSLVGYDAYVFCGFHCLSGVKNKPNVWLSPAIIQFLYNDTEHAFVSSNLSSLERPFFELWCSSYKKFDQMWVRKMGKIVANSRYTQRNIARYYGRSSEVVYPGIETSKYYCKSYENFFIVSSRFVKEKRINLIIDAFKEMPDKSLLIAGDGPERRNLEKIACGYENVHFLGNLDHADLIDFYSRCTGTIGMSISESFGQVPVESMASGKPAIGVNSTGYKETILPGKTGFLIDPTKEEIKRAVSLLTPEMARTMKDSCIKQAKTFDISVYVERTRSILVNLTS